MAILVAKMNLKRIVAITLLFSALGAAAVTPEVGQARLRTLIKLPSVSFPPDWSFDPETGFSLGRDPLTIKDQIGEIIKNLHHDGRDAEPEQTLADLYASLGDQTNASNAWSRAAAFYRQRVELRPADASLLAGLGWSLAGAGRTAEAETILRRAAAGPKEWRPQVALGRFLDSKARDTLSLAAPPASLAEDTALARSQLDEAGKCFDLAAAAAPTESEPLLRRALHRTLRASLLNQISAAGIVDESFDPLAGCFPPESIADLRKASQLDEVDFDLAGATAMYEIYGASVTHGKVNWNKLDWNSLPGPAQTSLRDTFNHLEALGRNPDDHVAAGALEELGILQGPILHQVDRGIESLRRSVALQPSRHHAWEVLVTTLARAGRNEELLTVCDDLVKQDDSSRSHLLLAKAHERLKHWDSCEEEARQAVEANPDDPAATTALAAVLLRRSNNDPDVLSEADDWLNRAETAVRKIEPNRRDRQQIIDLTLTRGIYFALTGEYDTARHWVQTVLERDRNNQFARDILSAIDF